MAATCRRRTTDDPASTSGNHVFGAIGRTVYHPAMRRWSELAERVAATTRTSEKTALLADYLASLTPEELPIAVVFLTGRPFPEADQRALGDRLGGDLGGRRARRRGGPRRHRRRPTTATPT